MDELAHSFARQPICYKPPDLSPGGFSCFRDTLHRETDGSGVTGGGGGVLKGSVGKSYPWTVGGFFGNVELSLELWTVIAGPSGFND